MEKKNQPFVTKVGYRTAERKIHTGTVPGALRNVSNNPYFYGIAEKVRSLKKRKTRTRTDTPYSAPGCAHNTAVPPG